MASRASISAYSAKPPPHRPIIRSPVATLVTPSPTLTTSPAHSPPPGRAGAPGFPPSSSPRFSDEARTRTRISPGLGSGVAVSRSSTFVPPAPGLIQYAFILAPPWGAGGRPWAPAGAPFARRQDRPGGAYYATVDWRRQAWYRRRKGEPSHDETRGTLPRGRARRARPGDHASCRLRHPGSRRGRTSASVDGRHADAARGRQCLRRGGGRRLRGGRAGAD